MVYNTRFYNFSNLNFDDQNYVYAQFMMIESIEDTIAEYTFSKENSQDLLEQLSYEQGIKALEEAKQQMYSTVIEFIVMRIESYEEYVDEKDTDDYFFGMYEEQGIPEDARD